jgi:2-dehydro-3-deoxygalactonokinase
MADWSGPFIAVDWGTTNRRAYLLDAKGVAGDVFEDDLGVKAVASGGFERAVQDIAARLGELPMLLAGMIGSDHGWRQVGYLPCPADLDDLIDAIAWVEGRRIGIVPGLSVVQGTRGDVMRGEEVQLFGLARLAGGDRARQTVCHPGTHTKWAWLEAGRVTDFRTAMTGEVYSLLREHSVLASVLGHEVKADEHFLAGVATTFAGAVLTAELFSVRARVLLSLMEAREASSFASGLLIGCDLRAGLAGAGEDPIVVLGRPELTRLFAAALEHCGRESRQVDGADAFVAGMHAIRKAIA